MLSNSFIIKTVWKEMESADMRNTLFVFAGVLSIVLMIQWLLKCYREVLSLPPGPWGIPIVGYLLFIGQEKHTEFMLMAKKYGSLFSTRLGTQLTVVMSDYKMIRETLRREEFTGRPDTPFMQTLNGLGEFFQIHFFFLHFISTTTYPK